MVREYRVLISGQREPQASVTKASLQNLPLHALGPDLAQIPTMWKIAFGHLDMSRTSAGYPIAPDRGQWLTINETTITSTHTWQTLVLGYSACI
jgi:hypothetical protein